MVPSPQASRNPAAYDNNHCNLGRDIWRWFPPLKSPLLMPRAAPEDSPSAPRVPRQLSSPARRSNSFLFAPSWSHDLSVRSTLDAQSAATAAIATLAIRANWSTYFWQAIPL